MDNFPWNLARTFTVSEFHYFKYVPVTASVRKILREFMVAGGIWQICQKITNGNERKCYYNFRGWCLVINTAQLFCINDRIWYPINSPELPCDVICCLYNWSNSFVVIRSKGIATGSRKSRHCQTWLENRFSWNENLQQRQNWIAKSTNLKENAGKIGTVFVTRSSPVS